MKKAWLFLIVLALLVMSVPVFADGAAAAGPTVSFHMSAFWWLNVDPTISQGPNTVNGGAERVWPTADVAFDANNTMEIGLRLANGSQIINNMTQINGSLWHFMWTSDLTKALAGDTLPVDVKLTIGLQDSVLTNWWYDNNGWEWEYGAWSKTPGNHWDAGLITINGDSNFLGYSWAVGAGPVTLHWVNDFLLQNTLLGAEVNYMGFGFFASYGHYGTGAGYSVNIPPSTDTVAPLVAQTPGYDNVAIEAKYDVPQFSGVTLKPSVFFRTDTTNWVGGIDLTVGYQMFKLILGATTTNEEALQHYSATFHLLPVSPVDIYVAAYMDGASQDSAPLQAVDLGSYFTFGAFKAIIGWEIAGHDQLGTNNANGTAGSDGNVTLGNDNVGNIRNGFYFGSAISF